jgi:hypothetical protein
MHQSVSIPRNSLFSLTKEPTMNRSTLLISLLLVLGLATMANAQGFGNGLGDGTGDCSFIDEDGDGFNDLAPDADGDGIPNGLDPDYVPAADGTGAGHKYGQMSRLGELTKSMSQFKGMNAGAGYGPGDGSGTGSGPADGTGFGPGDGSGTGECDGSGQTALTSTTIGRRGGRR